MRSLTKKENNQGVALIVCITVISILVIFCFSLLLVSYTLYASQNKNLQSDRNAEAAKTLAVSIRQELAEGSDQSYLCNYLRYNVQQESWPFYEVNEEDGSEVAGHGASDAKRYFNLTKTEGVNIEGYPSQVELCMYWMRPVKQPTERDKTRLFVEITCRSGSQSYTIKSEYELTIFIPDIATNPVSSFSINPADNTIDTSESWRWTLVSSE